MNKNNDLSYRQADRQSPQHIHKVLSAVFKLCRPGVFLREMLRCRWQLSDEIIEQYILADPPENIVQRLYEEYGFGDEELLGVPGFYQGCDGRVQFQRHANIDHGVAIRSTSHKITGILLHINSEYKKSVDYPEKEFIWLSTKEEMLGTPSGSPIGMVGNPREYMCYDDVIGKRRYGTELDLGKRGNIFITDSFLKAAACHQAYGMRALFMTGVRHADSLPRTMEMLCRKSKSRQKVIIAPDIDWTDDPVMMADWMKIIQAIYSECLPIWIALWNPVYGARIDEVIRNGHTAEIRPKRISKAFLPRICCWADAKAGTGNDIAKRLSDDAHYLSGLIDDWEK